MSQRILVVPHGSAFEAGLVRDLTILAPTHLLEIVAHLAGTKKLLPLIGEATVQRRNYLDLSDIHGQSHAKRALEIVAAGGHSLFMIGPPGVGKTMIASRLVSILPEMSDEEALESAAIYSVCGKDIMKNWRMRPFRTPHHSASSVALVGGSNPPRPGEISLAHHGVLFMDELLEFNRSVLESLREPLESRYIIISRAAQQAKFPAKFQLVTAMNPCPCGYFGDANGRCSCTIEQVHRYRARLSGPFLDRLDVWIKLSTLSGEVLFSSSTQGDSSAVVRSRVIATREYATEHRGKINSDLSSEEVAKFCKISTEDQQFLVKAVDKLKLSARSYHKILRIARTIADLECQEHIQSNHLREAIMYRKGI
jgi:magnesium chelatase family protein